MCFKRKSRSIMHWNVMELQVKLVLHGWLCMTFKFITARVPHTQWTITLDLHLWQRLQHVVDSQQWVLLAYTMFAQTNRGCFCWATAHWTQWPRSPSSPLPSKQSFLLSLCRALQCVRALHDRTRSFIIISSFPVNHITLTRAKAIWHYIKGNWKDQ